MTAMANDDPYRPTLPVEIAAELYADRICAHCGHTVVRKDGSPTGYTHHDEWQGIRCPRRITGATPISDEALERIVAIIAPPRVAA